MRHEWCVAGSVSSPSLVQRSASPCTVDLGAAQVDDVVAAVMVAATHAERVRDAPARRLGVRHRDVEQAVGRIGLRQQRGPAADVAAVADRDLDEGSLRVRVLPSTVMRSLAPGVVRPLAPVSTAPMT